MELNVHDSISGGSNILRRTHYINTIDIQLNFRSRRIRRKSNFSMEISLRNNGSDMKLMLTNIAPQLSLENSIHFACFSALLNSK